MTIAPIVYDFNILVTVVLLTQTAVVSVFLFRFFVVVFCVDFRTYFWFAVVYCLSFVNVVDVVDASVDCIFRFLCYAITTLMIKLIFGWSSILTCYT